jgi:hypothetical protein
MTFSTTPDYILTMPQRYARILNAHFGNQLLPFPLKVPAFDVYLYWHSDAEGIRPTLGFGGD